MVRKLVFMSLVIFGGLVSVISLWFYLSLKTAVSPGAKEVAINIPRGMGTLAVAQLLHQAGLIHSPTAFTILVKLKGVTVKAGLYNIDPSQSLAAIAQQVSTAKNQEVTVTIPEGWRVEQIGQRLASQQLIQSANDWVTIAAQSEGYLFPDTYRFRVNISAESIRDRMTDNFRDRTKGRHLSAEDLILASIIEREAKHDQDRPKMAGVFKNRLAKGMPLEADPTVQYAVDSSTLAKLPESEKTNYQFWGKITLDQAKTFDHPYNTYRRVGLPPGPIANPGLKSLEAALSPQSHDYFYFFNLADGSTIYSKTLDEHNANKRKHGLGR